MTQIKRKAATKEKSDIEPQSVSGSTDYRAKSRNRIEEIRAKRKERKSQDIGGLTQRLSLPEDLKDPDWTYRWVNDTASRVHDLQARDWEVVSDEELAADQRNTGAGTKVERIGSARTVTTPEKMVLMRKPKEFYQEDKAKEQERIKEDEKGLLAGRVGDSNALQPGEHAYIPKSGMSIKSGN